MALSWKKHDLLTRAQKEAKAKEQADCKDESSKPFINLHKHSSLSVPAFKTPVKVSFHASMPHSL